MGKRRKYQEGSAIVKSLAIEAELDTTRKILQLESIRQQGHSSSFLKNSSRFTWPSKDISSSQIYCSREFNRESDGNCVELKLQLQRTAVLLFESHEKPSKIHVDALVQQTAAMLESLITTSLHKHSIVESSCSTSNTNRKIGWESILLSAELLDVPAEVIENTRSTLSSIFSSHLP